MTLGPKGDPWKKLGVNPKASGRELGKGGIDSIDDRIRSGKRSDDKEEFIRPYEDSIPKPRKDGKVKTTIKIE